jgi:hypothetical protein
MFVLSEIRGSGELSLLPPPLAGEGWGGGERAHMNVFPFETTKDVDARDERGHDGGER